MNKVELLAPGGDAQSVKAAILAGADAVYFGVGDYNARKRAKNIEIGELAKLVPLAHEHVVKMYLTLNTLLAENEIAPVLKLISHISDFGIDAIIVQDYGLLSILSQYADKIQIHASTQMTNHNREQINFLAALGVSQVNFSRELSLGEIKNLSDIVHANGMKSEVFVHGAYCISYSGQCYFSGHLYGLSGNKGSCVQPCRREFANTQVTSHAPFNMKDNSAFSSVGELIKAGVDSYKIEGRIKGADYVFTVVSAYREQIDKVLQGETAHIRSKAIEGVFHRDFSNGYLQGNISKSMFTSHSHDKSLKKIGTVVSYGADKNELKLNSVPLPQGAELHIRDKKNQFVCKGKIQQVLSNNSFRFILEDKIQGRIHKGYSVYLKPQQIMDCDFIDKLDAMTIKKRTIDLRVTAILGEKLLVEAVTQEKCINVRSMSPLSRAESMPLTCKLIQEKLGKLGRTNFYLGGVTPASFQENLFLPIRELNEMKREMIQMLEKESTHPSSFKIEIDPMRQKHNFLGGSAILINRREDLFLSGLVNQTLFEIPLVITKEIEDLFRENQKIIPWFQPFLVETHLNLVKSLIRKYNISKVLSENSGLSFWAQRNGVETIAGPHFNLTNSHGVKMLFEKLRVSGMFLSKELSALQISQMKFPPSVTFWFPLFEHQLLMNTRQCLVRNIIPCTKDAVDESCLSHCGCHTFVSEKQGKEIAVMKRPGFYSQIFQAEMRYLKKEFQHLNGSVDYWLMDLRDLPSRTQRRAAKEEIVKKALKQIASGKELLQNSFHTIWTTPKGSLQ